MSKAYIPVVTGWGVNGAAMWAVDTVDLSGLYRYGGGMICRYSSGATQMYGGCHVYSTERGAWAWIADRWSNRDRINIDTLPDWQGRNKD